MRFILDTNMYLHYNLFTECKWSDLFGVDELTLVVTPTIIKELDDKKYDQRDHIAKRAHEVISKFRNMSDDGKLPCGIAVEFPSLNDKFDWDSVGLNSQNADDRIIAEVLQINKVSKGNDICIVTADYGLEIKAKNHDIKVMPPIEAWKRKLKDPRDKEIEKLKEIIKNTIPQVKLCFYNECDHTYKDTFEASMGDDETGLFDDDYINKIYENVKKDIQKELSDKDYDLFLREGCIRKYKDDLRNYPDECLKYLRDINDVKTKRSLMIEIPFILDNSGNLPAEDLDIWMTFPRDLEVSGGIPEFPKQPKKPHRPKSYADCFSWDINAIKLDNSFLNNQKELIGPEIKLSTEISVHYHLKKLKHGLKYPLPLFVIFELKQRIHNFQIEYVINVGNHPKQINGKLFVMIKK
jgi:hypothetical protein